jgi:ATP-dependent Clp protease ATP-binding subunit ClpC
MNVALYIQETRAEGRERRDTFFLVRPLFFEGPERRAELLSRALARMTPELRRAVELLARKERHEELIRAAFCPEIETLSLDTPLALRRQTLRCRLLVASYRALDRRIAFSPTLPKVCFEMGKGETLRQRAVAVFTEYFRGLERDAEGEGLPEPEPGYVRGWVTTTDLDVNLTRPARREEPPKFMALFGPEKMNGRDELEKVGRRLEALYPDDLDRAILREAEVARLAARLEDSDRRPVLLVGPRQVGKTALIHECVFRKVEKETPGTRLPGETWLLSPQRLISGMMYAGQWENRLLAILDHAKNRGHVLYFDDLPGLFFAGVSASSDLNVAQVLRPYLERRDVRVLAEITPEGLRALQERDRGFAELFEIQRLAEPGEDEARRILVSVVRHLEGQHRCRLALDVLPTLMDLQRHYARDAAMPGRVAGYLRRLAAKFARQSVTRDLLLADYHRRSGIDLGILDTRRRLERRDVLAALGTKIVGQREAVAEMADVVSIAKARLNDPERPLATLLFLGPTGVGKTQSAKALAAYLFGAAERLVRLDMNEYVDGASAARLIGTWRQPEGVLTAAIRRQPYAVVLLDEIEKAHRDVHDLLLQLLGEGRLTDALGRTADFTNAVLIMTSNLGVRQAEAAFGFGRTEGRAGGDAAYRQEAERFFRPEFFNRIDRIVPFSKLTRAETRRIARMLIDEVFRRDGLRQRQAILAVEEQAMEQIVDQGYHPEFGARALKRALEQQLTQPVASRLAALEPGVPTVIHVYPGPGQVSVGLEPLRRAPRDMPPPVARREDLLDAVDAAMDRIDRHMATLQPRGRVVVGEVAPEHARYFALREQQQIVDRLLDRLMAPRGQGAPKPPHTNLRGVARRALHSTPRANFRDMFAAEDLRQYLAMAAAEAEPFGRSQEDEIRKLLGELALLQAMATAPVGQGDRAVLVFRSMAGRNAAVLADVVRAYMPFYLPGRFLKDRRVPERWGVAPNAPWALLMEGPGAGVVAAAEQGTHLIVDAHAGVEPVQALALSLGRADDPLTAALSLYERDLSWRDAMAAGQAGPQEDPLPLGPIVRVYDKPPQARATWRILDVRSGLLFESRDGGRGGGGRGGATMAERRAFGLAVLPPPPEIAAVAVREGGPSDAR